MPIETLDDIIEYLADYAGVYGSHDDDSDEYNCKCRICWTSELKDRVLLAVAVEKKLYPIEHRATRKDRLQSVALEIVDLIAAARLTTEEAELVLRIVLESFKQSQEVALVQ